MNPESKAPVVSDDDIAFDAAIADEFTDEAPEAEDDDN